MKGKLKIDWMCWITLALASWSQSLDELWSIWLSIALGGISLGIVTVGMTNSQTYSLHIVNSSFIIGGIVQYLNHDCDESRQWSAMIIIAVAIAGSYALMVANVSKVLGGDILLASYLIVILTITGAIQDCREPIISFLAFTGIISLALMAGQDTFQAQKGSAPMPVESNKIEQEIQKEEKKSESNPDEVLHSEMF